MSAIQRGQSFGAVQPSLREKLLHLLSDNLDDLIEWGIAKSRRSSQLLFDHIRRNLDINGFVRKTSLQLGVYLAIIVGAVGMTAIGSEVLLQMLSSKMTEMGYHVVKQNLPSSVETASLRPSVK